MPHVSRVAPVLALLYAAAAVFLYLLPKAATYQYRGMDATRVPRSLPNFSHCTDYDVGPEVRALFSSGDIMARQYGDGPMSIDFVMMGGLDKSSMHDPRWCLGGYDIAGDRTVRLPGTDVEARAFRVTGPDQAAYDVIYFYWVGGHIVNEYAQLRKDMLWRDLTGQAPQPIIFLRFCRLVPTESARADASFQGLAEFAGQMWNRIGSQLD